MASVGPRYPGLGGGGSKHSSLMAKASDLVAPQLWPHVTLQDEHATANLALKDIDFWLYVAGELEIVTASGTPSQEKQGRLQLLKQLAYLHVSYEWDTLRNV